MHLRPHDPLMNHALRIHGAHACVHLMPPPGQQGQHLERFLLGVRLAQRFPIHRHQRIRRQHHAARMRRSAASPLRRLISCTASSGGKAQLSSTSGASTTYGSPVSESSSRRRGDPDARISAA